MKLRVRYPMLVAAGLFVFSSLSASAATCKTAYYRDYLHRPNHKAMATTGGRWPTAPVHVSGVSCGNAWGFDTIAQAKSEALRRCRHSDRHYHDPGVCRIVLAK